MSALPNTNPVLAPLKIITFLYLQRRWGVSPLALSVPNIDSYDGLMHTLFALEDIYGFKITNIDGEICLSLKKFDNPSYPQLFDNFTAWYAQANKLREDQISKDEYDEWRYHYPMKDSAGITASVDANH